jgi:hypothetical protein
MPYLIGIFTRRKGQVVCVDIAKDVQYDDLQACKDACDAMEKADLLDREAALDDYYKAMQEFVMDEMTEDREPVEPHYTVYSYVPQLFTDAQIKLLP